MDICDRCGKEFDESFDSDTFEMETNREYRNLHGCLCADCAIEAINCMESGIYSETCYKCGRQFDPFNAESDFNSGYSGQIDMSYDDACNGELLCAECAIENAEQKCIEEAEWENDEPMNAYEAALVWESHGRDQDYMFDYTEEELEDALR